MTLRLERRYLVYAAVLAALLLGDRYAPDVLPDVLPDDAPIVVDGLHVLVLYESAERHRLTPGQVDVIDDLTAAGELRKWLESQGTFRVYDDDVGSDHADGWVKDALQKHDGTVPWLLVANRRSGFVGPLPDGTAAVRSLVEEHLE